MSAPDVLAVMDGMAATCAEVWAHTLSIREARECNAEVSEARAAVAEAFAERDRLRNIVRSHEAQILRMTAERAELVEAARKVQEKVAPLLESNGYGFVGPMESLRTALARFGVAK